MKRKTFSKKLFKKVLDRVHLDAAYGRKPKYAASREIFKKQSIKTTMDLITSMLAGSMRYEEDKRIIQVVQDLVNGSGGEETWE